MEIWKSVYGFPHYEVSNYGRVKSLDRYIYQKDPRGNGVKVLRKGKILVGGIDSYGYRIVLLYYSSGGNRYTAKVHRLVADAFIPNPEGKPEVNHKDGNKQNNLVTNLEWHTTQENVQHAFDTGLKRSKFQDQKRPVAKVDIETGEILKVYESAKATVEDGFHRQSVGRVCRGQRPHHKGFKWVYYENV